MGNEANDGWQFINAETPNKRIPTKGLLGVTVQDDSTSVSISVEYDGLMSNEDAFLKGMDLLMRVMQNKEL